LDTIFWPVIVLIVVLTLITVIGAILLLLSVDDMIVTFVGLAILIITLLVSLFYYLSAYRVYAYIKTRPNYREKFLFLVLKLIFSAILTQAIFIVSLTKISVSDELTSMVTRYLNEIFAAMRSTILIEIFQTPVNQKPSSGTNFSLTDEKKSEKSEKEEPKTQEVVSNNEESEQTE